LTKALSAFTFKPRPSPRVHLLIMACAVSAGVHAVLAPAHLQEGTMLGLGFGAAALALAALAVALDLRPWSRAAMHAAVLVLGGLIVAYLATRTASVPLMGDHREPLDAVGVATKLIEALGLAMAVQSINEQAADENSPPVEKGVQS
jgi:hypothetical protein